MTFKTFIIGLLCSFGLPLLLIVIIPFSSMQAIEPVSFNENDDGMDEVYVPRRNGRITDGAKIYGANGCYVCHSQLVRPTSSTAASDVWRSDWAGRKIIRCSVIGYAMRDEHADLLASDQVEVVGFTRDVGIHYANADVFVFPSLEEGDPLVSYEAAMHGLPVVASPEGAGRMGTDQNTTKIINPKETNALEAALMEFYRDPELRLTTGALAAKAVQDYDWHKVGARRFKTLSTLSMEAAP